MKYEKKSDLGSITVRVPNIPEVIELLGRMGFTSQNVADMGSVSDLVLTGKIMTHMGFLVESVAYKIDGREITSYEALCREPRVIGDLFDVAGRVMMALLGGLSDEKKTSLETQ